MRVVIATTKIPFISGGAETHATNLRDAIIAEGHDAEIFALPYRWYPPELILDHMLACRLLDLTESEGQPIDRMIGLKFPAYLIKHPNKVLWILHQHRQAYDLWNHPIGADLIHYPNGLEIRNAIRTADTQLIPEAKRIYSNSGNVAKRLKDFCGLESRPLYHPPPGDKEFYSAAAGDYLFFPSRLLATKRQSLVLEALALTKPSVKVVFAGTANDAAYGVELSRMAERLGVSSRVSFRGSISEATKRDLYANCLGVVYPPVDEDYGYVTLEAMLSAKPTITCLDSGGPLEFIEHRKNGLICESTARALADAMDFLFADRALALQMGKEARSTYGQKNISWPSVVRELLS